MSDRFRSLSKLARVVTGRQMAGRGVTVFPDDVFVVSYPRSGNTWTRFLIGNLIYQDDPVTFANIETRIPEIYFNADRQLRRLKRPRILKSHESFQPHYPAVIYIVRDPRDVAVSYYHHNVKAGNIADNYAMEDFIPRFMAAEFDPKLGSWFDNVLSWLRLRQGSDRFLFLQYEEMKQKPAAELERIAQFLERRHFARVDSSPDKLARAVELSSPQRMRELEKTQAKDWVLTRQMRQDKPFVRTATAGGWKATLSEHSVALLEAKWGGLMKELGYSLATPEKSGTQAAASTPH